MLSVIFWLPPTALYIFVNVVLAQAVWEFYRICEAKGLRTYKVWGVIGTLALVSGSWFFYRQPQRLQLSYDFDVLILLVFALGVFIRQFPQKLNPQGSKRWRSRCLGSFMSLGWAISSRGSILLRRMVVISSCCWSSRRNSPTWAHIWWARRWVAINDSAHQPEENVGRHSRWDAFAIGGRLSLSLGHAQRKWRP